MSQPTLKKNGSPIRFLFEYSGFLLAGSLAALIWANLDPGTPTNPGSYRRFVNFDVQQIFSNGDVHSARSAYAQEFDNHQQEASPEPPQGGQHDEHSDQHSGEHQGDELSADRSGQKQGQGHHGHALDIAFLVNNVLMALFFAIAAKEVREALLPGGPLSNIRTAATPLMATLGGVVGPALIYLGGAMLFGRTADLGNGWAVPCATDIAFSYLVARLIFGSGHPAIAFLLLLAIADDAIGLIILALFYPSGELHLWWMLLAVAAMALCFVFSRLRIHSFWIYLLIPGVMSWFAFFWAGIHPALGLVPVICCMPHAHTDLGLFAREQLGRNDTLNEFEHWWKNPVEVILGLFGLVNAGVVLSSMGTGTWLVLAGLLLGKPIGITLFTWLGVKAFKLEIPGGMNYRHVVSIGMVAAIGFTVALFVSVAAFREPGAIQDSVKMGALLSFAAAALAFVGARMLGIRPLKPEQAPQ